MSDNVFSNIFVTQNGNATELVPVGQTFVLGSDGSSSGGGVCKSILGFRNSILTSTVLDDDADPKYPFTNALDYRDNTQYSPLASSGSVVIEFRQTSNIEIDYMGIAIHNGKSAGLTGYLELLINGVWEVVANFSPIDDLRTMCETFDLTSCQRQRLTLNFTSKLFIGTIYMGKSWQFSRLPNEGFTPANSNNIDQVVSSRSNNSGQFLISRRKEVGYAQSGEFDFISFDEIKTEYIDYMHHVKDGKPFFMKWDIQGNESIFGQHASPNSLRAPSYTSANTSTFSFEMVGYN